jgi:hypothetical protein
VGDDGGPQMSPFEKRKLLPEGKLCLPVGVISPDHA